MIARRSPFFLLHRLALSGVVVAVLALAVGCDTSGTSIYDPDPDLRPDPQITSIEPQGGAFAGVGTLTINGSNFAENPEDNLVYFDGMRARVVTASPAQLVVATPNLPGEAVEVRVAVIGAENLSNMVSYRLQAAVEEFGAVSDLENVFALTSDADGTLYASVFFQGSSSNNVDIQRIAPDGSREDYIDTENRWDALVLRPNGLLYGVRAVRAVFRYDAGGAQENWAILPDRNARLAALAFDADGNAWTAGRGAGQIYRIAAGDDVTDEDITAFAFEPDVQALTVYDGALYAAASDDAGAAVWRFPIVDGSLGAPERYFDLNAAAGASVAAFDLAFAASGELFVATDADDPLWLIEAGGGAGAPYFPGLLQAPLNALAWGVDGVLYAARSDAPGAASRIFVVRTGRTPAP